MLKPPVMARPFGQVVEPVRTKSASSLQKNVGLKISMKGHWATPIGSWACAPGARAGPAEPAKARMAARAETAISRMPDGFMEDFLANCMANFMAPPLVASGLVISALSLSRQGVMRNRTMACPREPGCAIVTHGALHAARPTSIPMKPPQY